MADKVVFLDTNGWLALLNSSDALHAVAEAKRVQLRQHGYSVVVTDWVVAETGNGLARTAARAQFPKAVKALCESPRARLVFIDEQLALEALKLYEERADKTWGLVDCASFVVMRDAGCTDAFTDDRHFEQAGFRCLLSTRHLSRER